jgi:hypothetical protein
MPHCHSARYAKVFGTPRGFSSAGASPMASPEPSTPGVALLKKPSEARCPWDSSPNREWKRSPDDGWNSAVLLPEAIGKFQPLQRFHPPKERPLPLLPCRIRLHRDLQIGYVPQARALLSLVQRPSAIFANAMAYELAILRFVIERSLTPSTNPSHSTSSPDA